MKFDTEEQESLAFVGKHSGLVSFSLILSRLLRFAFIVLLVRSVGPTFFGVYAAMVSYILIVAPISTFGYQHLFVQHLARKEPLPSPLFTSGFLLAILGALGFGLVGTLGFRFFIQLPLSWGIIFLFIATEIWSSGTRELFKGIFQGFHRFPVLSLTVFLAIPIVRVMVLVAFMLFAQSVTLSQLILVLAPVQILLIIILFFLYVPKHLFGFATDFKRIPEGIYYSVATLSNEVYGNVDKLMLSKLGTMEVVGFYTVAFRLVRYLFTPVVAVLTVLYPIFFRRGQQGLKNTFSLGLRVSFGTLVYALVLVFGVFVTADWVTRLIFGHPVPTAAGVMKILSWILVFKAFSHGVGDALTGAGYQKQRTYILIGAVVLNFVLNLLLIPFYGAYGAAWASVVSEGLLTAGILGFAMKIQHGTTPGEGLTG